MLATLRSSSDHLSDVLPLHLEPRTPVQPYTCHFLLPEFSRRQELTHRRQYHSSDFLCSISDALVSLLQLFAVSKHAKCPGGVSVYLGATISSSVAGISTSNSIHANVHINTVQICLQNRFENVRIFVDSMPRCHGAA